MNTHADWAVLSHSPQPGTQGLVRLRRLSPSFIALRSQAMRPPRPVTHAARLRAARSNNGGNHQIMDVGRADAADAVELCEIDHEMRAIVRLLAAGTAARAEAFTILETIW